MRFLLLLLHFAVCTALIVIVLLQKGKGASMGAAFGGSSQTIFGSTGATPFLSKITVAAAILFMFTSLTLAFFFGRGATTSVMKGVTPSQAPVSQQAETPAPPSGEQK